MEWLSAGKYRDPTAKRNGDRSIKRKEGRWGTLNSFNKPELPGLRKMNEIPTPG
jgi:hypothetical protein